MCGIVAAITSQSGSNVLTATLEGLKRLEYRGYDSCGIAYLESVDASYQLKRARSTDRISSLSASLSPLPNTHIALGHTRWATHGKPSTDNSHPLFSHNRIAIVHNGIIENYQELREQLRARGFTFVSETDTEVIAHLVYAELEHSNSLKEALIKALPQLKGAYAVAVIDVKEPQTLLATRSGSPLVIGYGEEGNYLASDAMAMVGFAHQCVFLEEGDIVELNAKQASFYHTDGTAVERSAQNMSGFSGAADLGPYRHYMQKEIFEQPRAFAESLEGITELSADLFGPNAKAVFADLQQICIVACGTSYYAGLVAQYWIEAHTGISVRVEIASELRYRDAVLLDRCLLVAISQSGETADTLSAIRHTKALAQKNNKTLYNLAICNVASSALVRESDLKFITRAGVEVGVASTKAFTTQLLALLILSRALTTQKNDEAECLERLRHLPQAATAALALEPQIIAWAERFNKFENALFLGRGLHHPIALEGALKLKEVSYIHAEAYPAGELKHGPLALVSDVMPVVVVAPNNALLEKLLSNIQEVKARGGQLFVIADKSVKILRDPQINMIHLPEDYRDLSPIIHTLVLQLLAYHTAALRGTDVDKPRNLAKSVTVE